MSSLNDFLKEQGFEFTVTDKEVRLEKSKKINKISVVVGAIGVGIFIFLGYSFPPAAVLMYVIAVIILLLVMRFNFRGYRPITIFDWTYRNMIKKSVYFFLNSKSYKIDGYQGVDVRVIDWSSKSSEGVDEFQKTIFLKTNNGEIDVVDFYTEVEPLEPELTEIMQAINDHLLKKQ